MESPAKTLMFALEKYPEQVEAVPIEELVIDSARQNPRRPAYLKLAVPDEMVKALRGRGEKRDTVLLVRIPSDVSARSDSRIILPGEVG